MISFTRIRRDYDFAFLEVTSKPGEYTIMNINNTNYNDNVN